MARQRSCKGWNEKTPTGRYRETITVNGDTGPDETGAQKAPSMFTPARTRGSAAIVDAAESPPMECPAMPTRRRSIIEACRQAVIFVARVPGGC